MHTHRKTLLEIKFIYLGNKEVYCIFKVWLHNLFIFHQMLFLSWFFLSLFQQYVFHKPCTKNLNMHPGGIKVNLIYGQEERFIISKAQASWPTPNFPIWIDFVLWGGANKSLSRPTSQCRRTESIVSLERGVCSCAELQVFSCYRGWKEACKVTHVISTTSRRELSSSIFSCKARLWRKFTPFWQKH